MTINGREEEKLTALASWIDIDVAWLRHVWDNNFQCACEAATEDEDYHKFCPVWETRLIAEREAVARLRQKHLAESDSLMARHARERQEAIAELDRQGLLP
jgi:hypothetical protein